MNETVGKIFQDFFFNIIQRMIIGFEYLNVYRIQVNYYLIVVELIGDALLLVAVFVYKLVYRFFLTDFSIPCKSPHYEQHF